MRKIDRDLRKFVTALLKHADNSTEFPIEFTAKEISEIFRGWTERDFNLVHHGAGEGCCLPMVPDRWRINIAHCKSLQRTFNASRLNTCILCVAILALIAVIIFGLLNYKDYKNETYNNDNKTSEVGSSVHN